MSDDALNSDIRVLKKINRSLTAQHRSINAVVNSVDSVFSLNVIGLVILAIITAILLGIFAFMPTSATKKSALIWSNTQMVSLAHSIKQDVVDSYVEVDVDQGLGSGTSVKVGDEVLVLTAGHVVQDSQHVKIKRDFGPLDSLESEAEVVAYSAPEENGGHDLALLKPKNLNGLRPAQIDTKTTLDVGEPVWFCGTPSGVHGLLDTGIISRLDFPVEDSARNIKTSWIVVSSAGGWFGNSGGGLFVEREGRHVLVGVVVRLVGDRERPHVGCQNQKTIEDFLGAYLAQSHKMPKVE